ncbi:MAG: YIP1 family protein [Acetivibrionales bacterium]
MSDTQIKNMDHELPGSRPGFFRRLIWLFASPGRLMEELAEKPRVLFWLILGSVTTAVPFAVRMPLYEEMVRKSIAAQSEYLESFGLEMTPEMIEAGLSSGLVTGLVTMPFQAAVVFLLTALLYYIIMRIMGGEGKFKAYLSVVVHAGIISVLYTLMLTAISYYTGSLHQTAALTSLASLVSPEDVDPYVYGFLAGIDVFTIWRYVLMAIGFTAVSKLKKKHVYIVTAIIFIIGLVIGIYGMPAKLQLM